MSVVKKPLITEKTTKMGEKLAVKDYTSAKVQGEMKDADMAKAIKEGVKKGDKTMSLWADMDDERAPRDHFVRSFAQRRQQIVGDCYQLKTDVDVYNAKDPAQKPIQVQLDFTYDVEELQLPFQGKKAA